MDVTSTTGGGIASLKILRSYPLRAALIWIALHIFVAASTGKLSSLGFTATLILAAVAGIVAFLDARRRREIPFLQNLGVSQFLPGALAVATVLGLEIVLAVIT